MRPQKAKREINKVLWRYFIENGDLQKMSLSDIIEKLKVIEPHLKKMYDIAIKNDQDFRSGKETYGYKSIERIKDDLTYISDKWNCSFRIRWILDLIKKH